MLLCTVEKANVVVNRLIEEGRVNELGLVVLDEVHMLAEEGRGYLLELLLTKLRVLSRRVAASSHRHAEPTPRDGGGGSSGRAAAAGPATARERGLVSIQLVAMSATLPNLGELARWLDAGLFVSDYRPVPLTEYVYDRGTLWQWSRHGGDVGAGGYAGAGVGAVSGGVPSQASVGGLRECRRVAALKDDCDGVAALCFEEGVGGKEVLVFCATKLKTVDTARAIASAAARIHGVAPAGMVGHSRKRVRPELTERRARLLEDLMEAGGSGLCDLFELVVPVGVGLHHAGLAMQERELMEAAFRGGTIRVLCCTRTLAAGVNLPARRVIFRSLVGWPNSGAGASGTNKWDAPLRVNDYRQMAGRAGRAGLSDYGESILIVAGERQRAAAAQLLGSATEQMRSCLARSRP